MILYNEYYYIYIMLEYPSSANIPQLHLHISIENTSTLTLFTLHCCPYYLDCSTISPHLVPLLLTGLVLPEKLLCNFSFSEFALHVHVSPPTKLLTFLCYSCHFRYFTNLLHYLHGSYGYYILK